MVYFIFILSPIGHSFCFAQFANFKDLQKNIFVVLFQLVVQIYMQTCLTPLETWNDTLLPTHTTKISGELSRQSIFIQE